LFVSVTYNLTQAKRKGEDRIMAAGPLVTPTFDGLSAAPAHARPSTSAAYCALLAIIFATFLSFFDAAIFGAFAGSIKKDFGLSDAQLGFLAGPATIICYFFIGIPLARLADTYPRKYVLSASAGIVGLLIALGGLAQSFTQFIGSRVFLAAGGSAHAPASYSLLADAFPPKTLTRAFAILQFGFIGGMALGPWAGGRLVEWTQGWGKTEIAGLELFSWQVIFLVMAVPSLLAAIFFLLIKEPARKIPTAHEAIIPKQGSFGRSALTFMGWDAAKAIHANGRVYYPLFGALALSAVESFGIAFWRFEFMGRSYGWTPKEIGDASFLAVIIGSLTGLVVGGVLAEWLNKRYKDANVRAAFVCFVGTTITTIVALTAPTGAVSMTAWGLAMMFAIAGAVPQNAGIQRVAPNAMRGQVTAFYLFMFTFFGAMGSWVIGLVSRYVVQDENLLWVAMLITAIVLLPLATYLMFRAIKPYREEVERLEALEKENAHV
jgi:MFS family permease